MQQSAQTTEMREQITTKHLYKNVTLHCEMTAKVVHPQLKECKSFYLIKS